MPLVSCILATKNRKVFLQQAIRYYQSQTCPNSELIIVDDSDIPNLDMIPNDRRIQYMYLSHGVSLGEKLNIGIRHSSGDTIQKLDDDDYYHPTFLETTSNALSNRRNKATIVAISSLLVLIVGELGIRDAGSGWFAGGTLCFHREAWESKPFRDVPRRVDRYFLDDHPELNRVPITNPELYVLVRHGRQHTWNFLVPEIVAPEKDHLGNNVTKYFATLSMYRKNVTELMGSELASFYQQLAY